MYEIRINDQYSHLLHSKQVGKEAHDTLPMMVDKTLLTTDLLKRIQSANFPSMDVLPLNCRYSRELTNHYKIVVVEEMPAIRTISIDLSMERAVEKLKSTGKLKDYGFEDFLEKHKNRPHTFSLSFPFLVYLFVLDPNNYIARLRAFYRLSPINSSADYLLQTNLLNVNESNNVCLGEGPDKILTASKRVNGAIKRFWTNTFNCDYHNKYDAYANVPEVSDYLTWSYLTKQNPMFIFNVKWLKHNRTFGSEIDSVTEGAGCNLPLFRNFENIADLFLRQQEVEVKTKEKTKTVTKKILTSRSESIFIDNRELSIGETITFKNGKEVKVYSFLSSGSMSPSHMQIINSKQKISILKLKPEVMKFLNEQFDESKVFSSIKLPNGEIIQVGDIVVVDYPTKAHKKVEKIMLGIDGKVDVKLSNKHYLAANLDAKVVDISKFVFGKVKLIKGKDYIMALPQGSSLPISSFKDVKFVGIDLQRYGDLAASFKEGSSNTFKLSLNENKEGIYDKSSFTQVSTFRLGVNLFTNDVADTIYLTSNQVLLHQHHWRLEFISEVAKADILKNKDEIKIKSIGLDIQFRVGDKVVVADWMDPSQMLKIHQIVGFTLDSDDILFINLKNKDGEKSIPYIDFIKGRISTGLVRKITNHYTGIRAGTKIKAKVSGISGFPMKDTNIIIGFVTDTGGPPLVLCSNCYTLWTFSLEEFEIIPRSSRIWKKLEHAPLEPGRVTFQPGDMFISEQSEGQAALYNIYLGRFNSLCVLYAEDLARAFTWGCVTHTFESIPVAYRYGLYSPRYSQTQLREFTKVYGFPNFHGLFTITPVKNSSSMGFRFDRRLLDV